MIDYLAKAEHFATLASRAAYQAFVSLQSGDADAAEQWETRAARYDNAAADYATKARRAA